MTRDQLRESWRRARAWRPPAELRAALDDAKVRIAQVREEVADDLAAHLADATDPGDVDRIAAQVYAAVVLALPGEAAGPLGALGEQVVAFIAAQGTRIVLRAVHERAEARATP